jgi:hypothetical protein
VKMGGFVLFGREEVEVSRGRGWAEGIVVGGEVSQDNVGAVVEVGLQW